MKDHFQDFPYTAIMDTTGRYFTTVESAVEAGHDPDQIWSVVQCDGAWTYGPPRHVVNLMGYIATVERHDGETYYHEEPDEDEDQDVDEVA